MPKNKPIGDCRGCDGTFFRYVDWTKTPTPHEPVPPCGHLRRPRPKTPEVVEEEEESILDFKKKDETEKPILPLAIEDIGLEDDKCDDSQESDEYSGSSDEDFEELNVDVGKEKKKPEGTLDENKGPSGDLPPGIKTEDNKEKRNEKQMDKNKGQSGDLPPEIKTEDNKEKKNEKKKKKARAKFTGKLDSTARARFDIDEAWYQIQAERFLNLPVKPAVNRNRWLVPLRIKHRIICLLNPIDTIRAKKYKEDRYGPLQGNAMWGVAAEGWGCGCPAMPCICHLHPRRPPRDIPKGKKWKDGAPLQLMPRLNKRIEIEERLHELLADLPVPHDDKIQSNAPLFCTGLSKCVAQRTMKPLLIRAQERMRREAINRYPCHPDCRSHCYISYEETVKMLRLQAGYDVLGPQKWSTQQGLVLTDICKDMKKGKIPFYTNPICYRVEEVRGSPLVRRGAPVTAASGALPPQDHKQHRRRPPDPTASHQNQREKIGGSSKQRPHTQSYGQPLWGTSLQDGDKMELELNKTRIVGRSNDMQESYMIATPPDDAERQDGEPPLARKDATQSTTEISCSLFSRKRGIVIPNRKKWKWEIYMEKIDKLYKFLKGKAKTLKTQPSNVTLRNLKYWLACCWLRPSECRRTQGLDIDEEDDVYSQLATVIRDEERHRNILLLRNYLVKSN